MHAAIRFLIISDFIMVSAFGLIGPIFAIFINQELVGGSIFAAGFAATLQLVTKSLLQLPFARWSDRGYRRECLIVGSMMFTAVPFLYASISNVHELFALQILLGIGTALAYPPWMAIFSHYVDTGKEGFEWSVYSTSIGIGGATAASVGGAVAMLVGFDALFIGVGILSAIGIVPLFRVEIPERKRLTKHKLHMGYRKAHNHRHI